MKHFLLLALLVLVAAPETARAQLMLPGALQAMPEAGLPSSDPAGPAAGKAKLADLKPPGEETILGRELAHDGLAGSIAFRHDANKLLEITRLTIPGEAISHPGEPCRVDVVSQAPISAKFSGRPAGVSRYEVEIEACPFSFEVLEEAVLITRIPQTCDFAAADCRADPTGLWGPAGSSIGSDQEKLLERDRGRAEASMRARFHTLLASVGKDKNAVKKIAGEQAGFSSLREVTCRNYAREDVHGFCALRITQARALALQAAFAGYTKDQAGSTARSTAKHSAKSVYKPESKPNAGVPPATPPISEVQH
ncbi:hypothetical protein CU048_04790 [Beijerinckiaceae bacterium]|nr:hypothetical protein CU048_04790 [Beijerinckiaceae bacterium]